MKNIDFLETSKSKYDKNCLLNPYEEITFFYRDKEKLERNVGTGPTCL